jgi:hypothetical protein
MRVNPDMLKIAFDGARLRDRAHDGHRATAGGVLNYNDFEPQLVSSIGGVGTNGYEDHYQLYVRNGNRLALAATNVWPGYGWYNVGLIDSNGRLNSQGEEIQRIYSLLFTIHSLLLAN